MLRQVSRTGSSELWVSLSRHNKSRGCHFHKVKTKGSKSRQNANYGCQKPHYPISQGTDPGTCTGDKSKCLVQFINEMAPPSCNEQAQENGAQDYTDQLKPYKWEITEIDGFEGGTWLGWLRDCVRPEIITQTSQEIHAMIRVTRKQPQQQVFSGQRQYMQLAKEPEMISEAAAIIFCKLMSRFVYTLTFQPSGSYFVCSSI